MSDLVGNPEDRFSRVAAQMKLLSNERVWYILSNQSVCYILSNQSVCYNLSNQSVWYILSNQFYSQNLYSFTTFEPLVKKPTMWFPNRSDANWAVQAQKMARDGKFWI